jgi:Tfp pilus assembly protein PilP
MRTYPLLCLIGMILSGLLLTSCQKQDTAHQDVSRFVKSLESAATTQKQKSGLKESEIVSIAYDGEKYRDPFELPASVKNVKQYPNAILGDMALDSLKLVGIVTHKDQRWAVFRASNGKLYKITEGMRVGTQQALLTDIKQNQAKFMIDAGEGDKPRELVMSVQEPK